MNPTSKQAFIEAVRLVETVKAHRAAAEAMNASLLMQRVSDSERKDKVRESVPREFAWVAIEVFQGAAPAETGWFLQAPAVSRPSAASEPPHE